MAPPNIAYPLRSWTLGGFRAILTETKFELGGLNLLVGANSAGKSSVLYSLLLTAQTLGTPTADRPLVLNGPQVRLGWAEDCVHEEANREMTIGFGLDPTQIPFGRSRPAMEELDELRVNSIFTVPKEDIANFHLVRTDMTALLADEGGKAHVCLKPRRKDEAIEEMVAAGLPLEAAEDHLNSAGYGVTGDIPRRTAGAYMRQFIPYTLAVVVNAYERELGELVRLWLPRAQSPMPRGLQRRLASISPPVARIIRTYVEHVAQPGFDLPDGDVLTPEVLGNLPTYILEAISELHRTSWLAEHAEDLEFKGEIQEQMMPGILDAGVDCAQWWFSQRVRHLGPLRAAPQPFYGLPEAASVASVGKNGEYTAAVLTTFGKQLGAYPLPSGQIENVRLGQAVDLWMKELALLASVHPREQGKYGYELNVSMDGVSRELDLTTVGVGVSQALPIIVLGLISEPGSLLLFEQPELHLHPDVQAGLGDFFLALARTGRQLIIETHSEYLINRLRRRQITDENPDASELTRLFFFAREGSAASIQQARIGRDGSMPDWPKGFLDTASREIQHMVTHRRT